MPDDKNQASRALPDPNWLDRSRNAGKTHFSRRVSKLERAREDALKDWLGPGLARTEILAHQHGAVLAGAVLGQILAASSPRPALVMNAKVPRVRWPWGVMLGSTAPRG